eukprot:scaffold6131_cov188-Prasinococcus_capsulatus_cf.AAC.1
MAALCQRGSVIPVAVTRSEADGDSGYKGRRAAASPRSLPRWWLRRIRTLAAKPALCRGGRHVAGGKRH